MSRLEERLVNFNKAFFIYERAVNAYEKDSEEILMHLALVQSFEICFELAWKVIKDYLKEKGIEAYTPKDVIKEAFAANIIPDGQLWIDMINDRNASSHEYNLEKVSVILEKICSEYYKELIRFKSQAEMFYV